MVLTPEFTNNRIALWIEGPHVTTAKWKIYVEKIITLR